MLDIFQQDQLSMNNSNKTCSNAHFPSRWRITLADALIQRQSIGESQADVFRLQRNVGDDLFIKSEPIGLTSELPHEIERIRWLNQFNIPGPTVIDTATENNRHWLLMSAVPGQDLASAAELAPGQVINIMATALNKLHQVPIEKCPFDHRLQHRIAMAKERVTAGLVDEENFDEERIGRSVTDIPVTDILIELLSTIPSSQDLVVTHGDACLPNFMADAEQFSGFIDCGRLGVCDRFHDLALSARSIKRNLGGEWVTPFFDAYGIEPDEEKIKYYCLLDEFF